MRLLPLAVLFHLSAACSGLRRQRTCATFLPNVHRSLLHTYRTSIQSIFSFFSTRTATLSRISEGFVDRKRASPSVLLPFCDEDAERPALVVAAGNKETEREIGRGAPRPSASRCFVIVKLSHGTRRPPDSSGPRARPARGCATDRLTGVGAEK